MDIPLIISLLLALFALIFFIAAIPFIVRELKAAANSVETIDIPGSSEVFARFSFTPEEWALVHKQEFLEDDKGSSILDKFAGIIRTDTIERDQTSGEIFFLPKCIYITDGRNGKLYKINDLNSVGRGIRLISIEPLGTLTLFRFSIRINASSMTREFRAVTVKLEFTVPLPRSARTQLDDILVKYREIIESSK